MALGNQIMGDLKKLADQMRGDWNRRIDHDYRFWMSDGHSSDAMMWETGERDFALISQGILLTERKVALEVGCGVGRILRAAAQRYKQVIGVDVSDKAIAEGRRLLGQVGVEQGKLQLVAGNGFDLSEIADQSVDLVFSFAAITSMPAAVMANYLREFHRVLNRTGVARIQMYLGDQHRVLESDTLHLRCYDPVRFKEACQMAGFEIEWIQDLKLPIQTSIEDRGVKAVLVSLKRFDCTPEPAQKIQEALLPEGEIKETEIIDGDNLYTAGLEHWMALKYAEELSDRGDVERAKAALEYAASIAHTTSIDVSDVLHRIVGKINASSAGAPEGSSVAASWREQNLAAVARRGERTWIYNSSAENTTSVTTAQTSEGPILQVSGQVLDHPQKPVQAARAWAERTLAEPRIAAAEQIVVYGFGAGYHVEALLERTNKLVSVIEPSRASFDTAIAGRNLTNVLDKLHALEVGCGEDETPRLDFLSGESELVVRPQSQSITPKFCTKAKSKFYGTRGITALHPNIAVLGPFTGGTLPISEYVSRAAILQKQRTRYWDVSGFAKGLTEVDRFLVDPVRQNVVRGSYIEMVSHVLLESATEKPIDVLICLAQAPISGTVLNELRKRGVVTALWFTEDYLRFTYWKEIAQFFDFVFTIQTGECMDLIKRAGAGEVHYLPMACDPGIHRPLELTEEERQKWGSPISFVGAGYHNRQQVFASMADMPFKIWGTEWPTCRPFDSMVKEEGRRLKPEEYTKIFNSTDINLNLHSSTERDGVDPTGDFVNPRTFELASAGAFQLCDRRSLLAPLFKYGEEIVVFDSVPEMKEQIRYYLEHPEERRVIAERARARALSEHTYQHRMQEMMKVIYSSKFEHLKRRQESSPWKRMLDRAKPHAELLERCNAAYQRGEDSNLDGLVSDIVTGNGKLTETEQKLLFLYHVRKQIIRMRYEESEISKSQK